MIVGTGKYTYEIAEGWGQLPEGWTWGCVTAVACDSQDRVYVYARSEHPLIIFDRDGTFLASWGEDILEDAHGLYIDAADNVYCTERNTQCIRKFNSDGQLVMTIGTPNKPAAKDGDPFNKPTDVGMASNGDLFISDGYGNARVHKYSPDGELLLSWGERGSGPGQFDLSHCARVDRYDRVWVCDRQNWRIQIFDTDGNYLTEWTDLARPDTVFFDPQDDVVYMAEVEGQVSIYTFDGELITKWGGARRSDVLGGFLGGPHGIWMDSHGDLYVGEVETTERFQKFIRQ